MKKSLVTFYSNVERLEYAVSHFYNGRQMFPMPDKKLESRLLADRMVVRDETNALVMTDRFHRFLELTDDETLTESSRAESLRKI